MTLALDLEGTLIKDQLDPQPRPGLYHFLSGLALLFSRVAIMTTVPEPKFREIAQSLVDQGTAPDWFTSGKEVTYIYWERPHKDLMRIPGITDPSQAWLVDDYEGYVHPAQKERWIPIETFFDQGESDRELYRIGNEIRRRMDRPPIHYGEGGKIPFIRISELPENDREAFGAWLVGRGCPVVAGEERDNCAWPWDYEYWRREKISSPKGDI